MRKVLIISLAGAILLSFVGFLLLFMNMQTLKVENHRMVTIESMIGAQQDISLVITVISLKKNIRLQREWTEKVLFLKNSLDSLDTCNVSQCSRKKELLTAIKSIDSTMLDLFPIQGLQDDHNKQVLIKHKLEDLKGHLAIQTRELGRQLYFLHNQSQTTLARVYRNISTLLISFIAALLTYAFISSLIIRKKLLTPLRSLLNGLTHYKEGNFSFRLPPFSSVELATIGENANQMAQFIENSMVKKERLEGSEKRFRNYFKYSATAQLICTEAGEVLYFNNEFSTLLDNSNIEITRLASFLNPEYTGLVLGEISSLKSSLESFKNLFIELLVSAYSKKPCLVSGVLLEPGKVILSLEDITQLILYQTELERSNRELEQFAYVASHDLREPLRMVTSFTQLLKNRYSEQLGEEGNEFVDFAVDGARRMNTLVDDLLRLSRINTVEQRKEAVSLSLVLELTKRDLQILIQEHAVTIHITMEKEITVWGDITQIKQVFQNFITNAIKFTSQDRAPYIEIAVMTNDGFAEITISDNGIGISQEHYERIFQVFKRLHTRSEYEGNGIGLSICKRIIEKHGGTVSVSSQIDKGTSFTFTLELFKEAS